jgi:anti-sigma factor RsiW
MMAARKKVMEQEPSEIELLLPWHAAGTLSARDARRVDEALARDPALARQYAVIREEYAGTIDLNENLGAPSVRAMQKLFTAIDAEPERKPSASLNIAARFSSLFSGLSPRTLAWSASLGALVLVLQAGIIAGVLMDNRPSTFQTASLSINEQPSITRDLSATPPPRALVRFAADARVGDITALLDKYQASIVSGAKGGMFRLQFANGSMSKDEFANLLSRLQNEKTVSLAVATP